MPTKLEKKYWPANCFRQWPVELKKKVRNSLYQVFRGGPTKLGKNIDQQLTKTWPLTNKTIKKILASKSL